MPLFVAPPPTSTSVAPLAVRRHVDKAKIAITPIYLHLSADPAGGPLDFDASRLE